MVTWTGNTTRVSHTKSWEKASTYEQLLLGVNLRAASGSDLKMVLPDYLYECFQRRRRVVFLCRGKEEKLHWQMTLTDMLTGIGKILIYWWRMRMNFYIQIYSEFGRSGFFRLDLSFCLTHIVFWQIRHRQMLFSLFGDRWLVRIFHKETANPRFSICF